MIPRVTTCEGTSTDYSVASLPDAPFHPPVTYNLPNMDFGKGKRAKY